MARGADAQVEGGGGAARQQSGRGGQSSDVFWLLWGGLGYVDTERPPQQLPPSTPQTHLRLFSADGDPQLPAQLPASFADWGWVGGVGCSSHLVLSGAAGRWFGAPRRNTVSSQGWGEKKDPVNGAWSAGPHWRGWGAVSWFRPASGREVASKQAPQPGWVRWSRAPAVLGLSNWRNCCEVVSAALAERPVISRWHVCKCWFCGCYLIHAGGEKPRVGGRLTSQRQASSRSGLGSRTWGGVSSWGCESDVGASLAHGLRTEKRMWKRSCWQMSAAFIWAIVPVSW